MPATLIDKRINELNDILKFSEFFRAPARTYSRGMRQKITFAISVIHDPDFLLLDEPTTGLDLEAAGDVVHFIQYLKTNKKAIFISTHNVYEISELSDRIALLSNGKIAVDSPTSNFFKSCAHNNKIEFIIDRLNGETYHEKHRFDDN